MIKRIYVHRDIEKVLLGLSKQFPAIIVTGPRQSGKSTLIEKVFAKTHTYLSFDDLLVRQEAIFDPKFFLEKSGPRIIIDEIQYVPQILSYIKILIDKNRSRRGYFILTGSQQFSLMKDIGDTLAGRVGIVELLPFSVSEKKRFLEGRRRFSCSQDYFIDACMVGSFPEITVYKNIEPRFWYSAYLQTYLERDVRSIYNIGNLGDFQRLLQLLAARCSQILNLSAFSSELGIAVNTIKRWISILEASRIIFLLQPYYQNLSKRITKSPKIYFLDCGLACYLLSIKDKDYLVKGPMAGALFENFCVQETVKYLLNQGERPRLFYVRTHNGLEVDLLIEKDARLYPIEFKLSKTPAFNMAGPIIRFRELFSNLNIASGKIVSLGAEKSFLTKDVLTESVEDYLSWLNAA